MSVNEKMTAIADKIRQYTGGKSPLTLDGIAQGIDDVANLNHFIMPEGTTMSVTITANCSEVPDDAFNVMSETPSYIKSVIIETRQLSIGDRAFMVCGGLEEVRVSVPSQISRIGIGAFLYCKSLRTVDFTKCTVIPELGDDAFPEAVEHADDYFIYVPDYLYSEWIARADWASYAAHIVSVTCEHEYDVTTVEPTCTEAGYTLRTCTKCGKTIREELPALGHNYEEETIAATCGADGYTLHNCTRCGDSYTDNIIPATGEHTVSEWVWTEGAECGHGDIYKGTCSVCGKEVTKEEGEPGEHYWELLEDGTYYCPACGATKDK